MFFEIIVKLMCVSTPKEKAKNLKLLFTFSTEKMQVWMMPWCLISCEISHFLVSVCNFFLVIQLTIRFFRDTILMMENSYLLFDTNLSIGSPVLWKCNWETNRKRISLRDIEKIWNRNKRMILQDESIQKHVKMCSITITRFFNLFVCSKLL